MLALVFLGLAFSALASCQPLLNIGFIPYGPGLGFRVDHMSYDSVGQRLFVTMKGQNGLSVLDVVQKRQIAHVTDGCVMPNDVIFTNYTVPPLLYVSNSDGYLRTYDANTYKRRDNNLFFPDGAENMRHDLEHRVIYLANGNTSGAISVIYTETCRKGRDATANLNTRPEMFAFSFDRKLVYVNAPGKLSVLKVKSTVGGGDGSFVPFPLPKGVDVNKPIVLVEPENVLVIVTREPPKFIVMSAVDGAVLNVYDTVALVGDVFFDRVLRRIYVLGAEGNVQVWQQADETGKNWTSLGRFQSGNGAWTGQYSETERLLFVATQSTSTLQGGILIYRVQQ